MSEMHRLHAGALQVLDSHLKSVFSLSATLAFRRLDSSIVQKHMQRELLLLVLVCELFDGPVQIAANSLPGM